LCIDTYKTDVELTENIYFHQNLKFKLIVIRKQLKAKIYLFFVNLIKLIESHENQFYFPYMSFEESHKILWYSVHSLMIVILKFLDPPPEFLNQKR
jgi:hypothetical protein